MKRFLALCAVFSAVINPAMAANLLVNPSFNSPDTNFEGDDAAAQWEGTDWTRWGNCFRQRWAAHSGHAGGYFRGWSEGTNGAGVYQNMSATGGTYTFTIWLRREPAFSLNQIDLKIEWLDADTNYLQTTFGTYKSVPGDGLWHPVYVTSTYTNTATASWVRPVLYGNWTNAGGSLLFDDAQLYSGTYTGATPGLLNPSFEFYTTNDFRCSQWTASGDSYYPLENPWEFSDWPARAGSLGLGLRGWLTQYPVYTVTVSQVVTPGVTGIYTFAGFLNREAGFLMTNAGMRIDVYDWTMTNLLQSAVTNLDVPGTTNFIEYYVTLDITNEAVWEVRPAFFTEWAANTAVVNRALRLDDFRFFPGDYTPWAPSGLDYIYFSFTNQGLAQNEEVPGLGGIKFLDYRYSTNEPSYVHTLSPIGALSGMRTRFYFAGGGGELWVNGSYYTSVVIDSSAPFHGYPPSGAATMEVWRARFWPTPNWQGNLWYAPIVKLAADGVDWWLAEELSDAGHPISTGLTFTNNWPMNAQRFWSQIPYDHDSYYYPTGMIDRWDLNLDWAYHRAASGYDARTEAVPGMTNVTFVQPDYANTQTIFWVVTEKPANVVDYQALVVQMRVSYPTTPPDGDYVENWLNMTWYSNVVLDAALNPFHGLPAAGMHTVDLWRVVWPNPLSNGVPDSRLMNVWYVPLLKTQVGFGGDMVETDYRYLVSAIEAATNRWGFNNYPVGPQYYGREGYNHDYLYVHQWSVEEYTDGIPNSWWSLYGDIPVDQWIATNDFDGDGYLNIEEYAGQTDPQDSYSFFPETGFVEDGVRVVLQMVVNPSSTQRIYDAYWKTNLMDYTAPWQSYGLSIMGQGGPITLTVTNNDAGGRRFYRTGARLP